MNPDGESSTPQIENGEITEPPQLVGDVNNDGVVNIQDLVIVGSNFGKTGDLLKSLIDRGNREWELPPTGSGESGEGSPSHREPYP